MVAQEVKLQDRALAQIQKQTNCLSCNKPIKKLKRYYRDGKFYCSKKCWKKFIASSKKEEEKK